MKQEQQPKEDIAMCNEREYSNLPDEFMKIIAQDKQLHLLPELSGSKPVQVTHLSFIRGVPVVSI